MYPIGAETVLPGLTPAAGQTMFAEFSTTYQANGFLDGQGHGSVPGFKLSVYAFAPKITHNWGVHLLGGDLVSWVAFPFANAMMQTPAARYSTTGISNPVLGVADVAYNRGNWHWWYGLDVETPAPVFHKGGPINIGQHNFATAPSGAFTYLPNHGKTEFSSRLQYIVNYTDSATNYHSGNEFLWEYVAMQNVTRKLAIGANGYFYQQTTADRLLGVIYAEGNQGRDFAIGPEVHYQLGPMVLIAKYFRDTLVENRPCGNAFWIEFAIPLSHGHAKQQVQEMSRLN
ncbi:MAG: transporter [Terriglobia bacterium]